MPSPIMRFFDYKHLDGRLREVSKNVCDIAWAMEKDLPEGAEKSAGLRKLLEAKDCFVRAELSRVDFLGMDKKDG